jgi:peptidyl-prolyl cis-trans isomerase D
MSIIQDIRDKYARISVIAIALALIGFILTDYVRGRDRGRNSGRSNSIGSVNGHSIGVEEFGKTVEQSEAGMKQQGYPEAMAKQQALEQAWSQHVNRIILSEEFDRLGMRIGKRERGDILYGPNAPDDIKKAGTDEKTGLYDPMRAKQQVDQMMKNKQIPQAQKDQFNDYINQLELQRKSEKYGALFTNSANFPRWFVEKQTADNSLLGKISMVKVFYTDSAFVDSTIKISDKEVADYLGKHKEDYKQEESRSINYVNFSAAPTAGDSVAVKNQVALLKAEFDTTKDITTFMARNGSSGPSIAYAAPAQMPPTAKDSILRLTKDQVFGPYLDGGNFVLAKLLDVKTLPDSVKCRHILLGTQDRSGNQIMEDTVAHKRADSIALAIKNGANFDSLETKFTTDNVAHNDKGVMTFSSATIQGEGFAKEFGEFILLEGKPGDKKVVKTQFGWHYIEILSFIKPETQYKVAYLNQEVVASQQTDGDALQAATNFAGDSRDQKSFDTTFEKTLKPRGINKGIGSNIKRSDAQVQGLGFSRNFVRNIYSAKPGEVLKPERIVDNYVVAIVTEVLKEGTMPLVKARPFIEPVLRNRKKAEMLKQKAGKITTLEAAAATWGKPIETVDSLRMKGGNPNAKFGYEPRVYGATFNPSNKGKVLPEVLEGLSGVYVIRVDNISATSAATGSVADQRKAMYQQAKQSGNNLIEALKKAATIKDKRADTY